MLLKEGIPAAGRSQEETAMILNHKRGFDFILAHRTDFIKPNGIRIRELHQLLVDSLGIPTGFRSRLMGITGSLYRPL